MAPPRRRRATATSALLVALAALAAGAMLGALPASANQAAPRSAGDGEIIFERNQKLVAIDADGEHPRLVGHIPGNLHPGFEGLAASPSGRTLAFVAERETNSDIYPGLYLMQTDGAGLHPLLSGGGKHGFDGYNTPAFMPGGRLVFSASKGHGGQEDLYSLRLNGTGLRQLTHSRGSDLDPYVSPDGRHILFTRYFGEIGQIFEIGPEGAGLRRLTSEPCEFSAAGYSPTGQSFLAVRSCDSSSDSILAFDSTTLTATTLAQPPSGDFDTNPYYSPSGSSIVFLQGPPCSATAERCESAQIFTMNADGSDPRQLTHTGPTVFNGPPIWVQAGN